ncbi:hypothetical protein [Trinickia mobilis]|uniref:hypothetical protein n=1 Tax=Trinickia mobilis TaxID=2816356 RepID=UPI001A8C6A5F|nr:hypothetical protein [Trinickia mobilis]
MNKIKNPIRRAPIIFFMLAIFGCGGSDPPSSSVAQKSQVAQLSTAHWSASENGTQYDVFQYSNGELYILYGNEREKQGFIRSRGTAYLDFNFGSAPATVDADFVITGTQSAVIRKREFKRT